MKTLFSLLLGLIVGIPVLHAQTPFYQGKIIRIVTGYPAGVQYDWAKYGFVGSPAQSEHHLYMRADAPYKNIEDVRKAAEPPKCGSGGATGTGFYFPKLLEETVGAKFNIVLGYQGGGPIDLAVEKGEIHCRAMTIESFMARAVPYLAQEQLRPKPGAIRPQARRASTRYALDLRADGSLQNTG